jgi:hypothetical protein
MKTPLLLFSFLFSFASLAQNTNDSLPTEQYCLVRIYPVRLTDKVEVAVDSGQTRKRRLFGEEVMRDKDTGEKKTFRSEADALNYFGTRGWKLVSAYPVIVDHNSCTNYLFKKPEIAGRNLPD